MSANPTRCALDTFALLAHLQAEPGGARVRSLLAEASRNRVELIMTIISYGEAVYITEREQGLAAAQELIAAVDQLPITIVAADRKLTFSAAHVKASSPLSYADAFAVALAREQEAVLVTGDPEFKHVQSLVPIEWLPQS